MVSNPLIVTKTGRAKAARLGHAGYDNPRENIDPFIKTKAISSKEYAGETSPIIIIAASDTPEKERRKANYICDGTADEAEINTAIDTFNSITGGEIKLLKGIFNIASPIILTGGVSLIGEGLNTTTLRAVASYNDNIVEWVPSTSDVYMCQIRDLKIDGNNQGTATTGIYFSSTGGGLPRDPQITRVFVLSCKGYGMRIINSWGIKILNSISEYCGENISLESQTQAIIQGCFFAYGTSANGGMDIDQWSKEIQLIGNYFFNNDYHGLNCDGDYINISENIFDGNGQDAASDHIFLDANSSFCMIEGNIFRTGTGTITENIDDDGANNAIGFNSDTKGLSNTYVLSGATLTFTNGILTGAA